MKKYILAIDQKTTSSRALIFDSNLNIIGKSQREVKLITPNNEWVELDPIELWIGVVECINEVLIKEDLTFSQIDSIGIANQRETIVVFNKYTGKPVYNAIVWNSKQTQKIVDNLKGKEDLIYEKTGLKLNTYFSASKIRFILDNLGENININDLYAGTIDSWLLYKLTNKKEFKTDISNASRTMLFNIHTLEYDDELLKLFNIDKNILPKVENSASIFGFTSFFNIDIPIMSMMGDQQAALFGQGCFNEGEFKNTYSSGCFMLFNTGNKPLMCKDLLTTIAWKIDDNIIYALEGSIFDAGSALSWIQNNLCIIKSEKETEEIALSVNDTLGIYFIPAFSGLASPYWDDKVRGSIFNLTKSTNIAHITRAALESIAYQTKDVFELFKKESKTNLNNLKADGGLSNNKFLMQFQSDILDVNIEVSRFEETTSVGVCLMAGIKSGFFKSSDEIKNNLNPSKTYVPNMTKEEREFKYNGWIKAIEASMHFKYNK